MQMNTDDADEYGWAQYQYYPYHPYNPYISIIIKVFV